MVFFPGFSNKNLNSLIYLVIRLSHSNISLIFSSCSRAYSSVHLSLKDRFKSGYLASILNAEMTIRVSCLALSKLRPASLASLGKL